MQAPEPAHLKPSTVKAHPLFSPIQLPDFGVELWHPFRGHALWIWAFEFSSNSSIGV